MIKACHVGVKGIVRVGDECLVLQSANKNGPYWDIPGGRIDEDETLEETLKRELNEELPTLNDFTVGSVLGAHRLSKNIIDDFGLVIVFFLVNAERFEVVLSGEHTNFKWVNKDTLPELLESEVSIEKGYYEALATALEFS